MFAMHIHISSVPFVAVSSISRLARSENSPVGSQGRDSLRESIGWRIITLASVLSSLIICFPSARAICNLDNLQYTAALLSKILMSSVSNSSAYHLLKQRPVCCALVGLRTRLNASMALSYLPSLYCSCP